MILFEILRFSRIIFQFSTFSCVLQRFSLLHVVGWLVRKTFVKQTRMLKTENLYDKISKSQIVSFTIWNTLVTLHAHQISARSEHSTRCTGERNFKPTIFLAYYGTLSPMSEVKKNKDFPKNTRNWQLSEMKGFGRCLVRKATCPSVPKVPETLPSA